MRPAILLLTLFIAFIVLPTCLGESVKLRAEPLTIGADLTAVSAHESGFAAVGTQGWIVASVEGQLWTAQAIASDLTAIDCLGKVCVAAGEDGYVVEIYPAEGRFSSTRLLKSDIKSVVMYEGGAALATDSQILLYDHRRDAVKEVIELEKVVDIALLDNALAIISGTSRSEVRLLDLAGVEVKISDYGEFPVSAGQISAFNGSIVVLSRDGIYTLDRRGAAVLASGAYKAIKSVPSGLLLTTGERIELYDPRGGVSLLATTWWEVEDVAETSEGFVAVGADGVVAMIAEGGVALLTVPSSRYSDIASWKGDAIIIGSKMLLHYFDGGFKVLTVGEDLRAAAYGFDGALLVGKKLWFYDGEDIKVVEGVEASGIRAAAYSGGGWFVLAGSRGMLMKVMISDGRIVEMESIKGTSSNLYGVSQNYAVGDKVAVWFAEEVRVTELESPATSVVETDCSALAVGRRYLYKLTEQSIGKVELEYEGTIISIKPDKAYALIGTKEGVLLLFDGYRVKRLPITFEGEVKSIAWISDTEALAIAGEKVYRIIEEEAASPTLILEAPKRMNSYTDTGALIPVNLIPMYGWRGDVAVEVEGPVEHVVAVTSPKRLVKPMCPVNLTIPLSVYADKEATTIITVKALEDGERVVESRILLSILKREEEGLERPLTLIAAGAFMVCLMVFALLMYMRRGAKRPIGGEIGEGGEEWGEGGGRAL